MSEAYRRAGVDLEAAAAAVARIREIAAGAVRPETVEGVGGFAGLFDLGDGRLLAAATDGVGTKLEIAREMGRLDTIGIDLVAMCANDVICTGAEPLFFLDYLAVGKLVPDEVASLVEGVAEGCRQAGCALLGGETAEHPGVLEAGRFDLAGFCVGLVARDEVLGPVQVTEGDVLLGLPSSGLHSNGFSLVRRVVEEAGLDLGADPGGLGRSLGEALLEPTRIYVLEVLSAARTGALHAAAHVTGGGIPENVGRILPAGLSARLDRGSWETPAVLGTLSRAGELADTDVVSTFNVGLGMVLAVDAAGADAVRSALPDARTVGEVAAGEGVWL